MKKLALNAVMAIVALSAFACSSSSDGAMSHGGTTGSGSKSFNGADVTFAQQMIPHHQQAVEMADVALKQAKNTQIIDLAKRIKGAQDPEIKQMQGWLKDWGASDTGTSMGAMDTGTHGSTHTGEGMMSADDMAKFAKATGAEFDKLFLSMMIKHHEGAVTMAKTELADGKSADAKKLATTIVKAQQGEIIEMKGLQSTVG